MSSYHPHLLHLVNGSPVPTMLERFGPLEWMILETRFEMGDPTLTMDERDALFLRDLQQTLSAHAKQTTAPPPRFPPRVIYTDC